MKLLQKLILGIVFSLSIFSVAIPVKASTTQHYSLYDSSDDDSSNDSEVVTYGEVKHDTYYFSYYFPDYTHLGMNGCTLSKSPSVTAHLNTTKKAGEKYLYFTIYKNKIFGKTKIGSLKFDTSKKETKSKALDKNSSYSFTIRKASKNPNKSHVMGTGWYRTK